jgi:thymidylate synthase
MKVIENDTIQEVYFELINMLKEQEIVGQTKEINNCCLIVNEPSLKDFWLPYRNISQKYSDKELEWYWTADNKCETIGKYAKMWLSLTDDGVTNNSAYGYILFKKYGFNQVEQIIELLKNDPTSRRAILNISDPTLDRIETKDLQCTIALQFLIRDGKLEETVYMRSNDVYFGLPYDYIFFITLGEYIASQLGIELGKYIHHATSMHMYLRDEHKFDDQEVNITHIDTQEIIDKYYKDTPKIKKLVRR